MRLDRVRDVLRLDHSPLADLAVGKGPGHWAEDDGAAVGQYLKVRLHRRVRPHAMVHRWGEKDLSACARQGCQDRIVGEPAGRPRHQVHGGRSDDDRVRPLA
jgi:hypothetical protein